MDAIFYFYFWAAPLGAVFVIVSALLSRKDRPRRAWLVLAICAALVLPISWAVSREFGWVYGYGDAAADWARTADDIAETSGMILIISLAAATVFDPTAPSNQTSGRSPIVWISVLGRSDYRSRAPCDS